MPYHRKYASSSRRRVYRRGFRSRFFSKGRVSRFSGGGTRRFSYRGRMGRRGVYRSRHRLVARKTRYSTPSSIPKDNWMINDGAVSHCTAGTQSYVNFQSLMSVQDLRAVYSALYGATPSDGTRFVVHSAVETIELCNTSNAVISGTWFRVKCVQDQLDGSFPGFGDLLERLITAQSGGTANMTNLGVEPINVRGWQPYYKILSSKRVILNPGKTVRMTLKLTRPRVINGSQLAETNYTLRGMVTDMFLYHGGLGVVSASQTHPGTPNTAACGVVSYNKRNYWCNMMEFTQASTVINTGDMYPGENVNIVNPFSSSFETNHYVPTTDPPVFAADPDADIDLCDIETNPEHKMMLGMNNPIQKVSILFFII